MNHEGCPGRRQIGQGHPSTQRGGPRLYPCVAGPVLVTDVGRVSDYGVKSRFRLRVEEVSGLDVDCVAGGGHERASALGALVVDLDAVKTAGADQQVRLELRKSLTR